MLFTELLRTVRHSCIYPVRQLNIPRFCMNLFCLGIQIWMMRESGDSKSVVSKGYTEYACILSAASATHCQSLTILMGNSRNKQFISFNLCHPLCPTRVTNCSFVWHIHTIYATSPSVTYNCYNCSVLLSVIVVHLTVPELQITVSIGMYI